ncbi:MAG: hypothetical protein JWO06_490 [Bacteroidota bacterium]|nr:hypothetical protein [Bacteroidota bacterium]
MITEATLAKVINQMHDINKRAKREKNSAIERSCERIKNVFEEDGVIIHDPTGEKYDMSRTDCEANIVSINLLSPLTITDVIKPVIYIGKNGKREMIQQGLVIVE